MGIAELASSKYVRLTTFRRDGTPVPTPVWIVPEAASLLVFTSRTTGKVKRLRHTPRVLLAPCDRRGRVAAGTADVEAHAVVVDDPAALDRLRRALVARYGLCARAVLLLERLRGRTGDGVRVDISS